MTPRPSVLPLCMLELDDLISLFAEEAAAEAHLRQVRAKLDEACGQYARQSGRTFMRKESVRNEVCQ